MRDLLESLDNITEKESLVDKNGKPIKLETLKDASIAFTSEEVGAYRRFIIAYKTPHENYYRAQYIDKFGGDDALGDTKEEAISNLVKGIV